MSNKDLKQIREEAERNGWAVAPTSGGHLKWKAPSGKVMFTAATPSDCRAIKNIKAWIRKIEQGLPIRG